MVLHNPTITTTRQCQTPTSRIKTNRGSYTAARNSARLIIINTRSQPRTIAVLIKPIDTLNNYEQSKKWVGYTS